jgi:predicted ABC-type transport system involved in lysophospholipase L1 biosynthesis ATPase subunit
MNPSPAASASSTASPLALEVRDVHRSFTIGGSTVEALRGVDLAVQAGEQLFLCGASGAGKTTLLYTLAGLEQPSRGNVSVQGQDLYGGSRAKRATLRNQLMGYVFQSYFLLPELTARENVALPSRIRGKEAKARAAELLDQVGLGSRLDHLPYELSGGEQQRVALARSLINDPPFLFADEPTGNLDAKTGGEVIDLLLGLVQRGGKTLIVVTHDPRLAARGTRQITLAAGRVVEDTRGSAA